jgi:sucrose-6-phosphate hydrolase SacC (GH32 family)
MPPRKLVAVLAGALLLATASADPPPRPDVVLADFEGDDYGAWRATGTAFGPGPAHGTLPNQQPVSGFLGRGLVNSYRGGDAATGTLTSPEFTVERRFLNFLIGGGRHPGQCCVNLLVDGKVVRSATGSATTPADDEHLSWHTWDVGDLAGRKARIEIVDSHTGGWGHINIDQVTLSDRRMMTEYAYEAITRAMASVKGAAARVKDDPARPVYHVMPPALWCNDPNGPIWHNGYYHLFYQHNPYGDRWEHMHWGHARSKDLVHWEHLPIALWPSQEKGEDHCFSGCATANADGKPVIFYTSIGRGRAPEQWLAVGSDDLLTWTKHPANPVLTEGLHGAAKPREWRDPFVFREGGKWYLVCGGHRDGGKGCIFLYRSDDLLKWEFLGIPFEGTEDNWECPNFFKLGEKWVLIYSPHGIVKYYTGRFDLTTHKFTPEHHGTLDYGDNFYAPNCCTDDKGRRILWGWVKGFPGGRGWNGCLTLPRVLTLGPKGELIQTPAPELEKLRDPERRWTGSVGVADKTDVWPGLREDALEVRAEFRPGDAAAFGLRLACAADGRGGVEVAYDGRHLLVAGLKVPYAPPAGHTSFAVTVFLDRSVLEVYPESGPPITRVVETGPDRKGLAAFARGGAATVNQKVWALTPAWTDGPR